MAALTRVSKSLALMIRGDVAMKRNRSARPSMRTVKLKNSMTPGYLTCCWARPTSRLAISPRGSHSSKRATNEPARRLTCSMPIRPPCIICRRCTTGWDARKEVSAALTPFARVISGTQAGGRGDALPALNVRGVCQRGWTSLGSPQRIDDRGDDRKSDAVICSAFRWSAFFALAIMGRRPMASRLTGIGLGAQSLAIGASPSRGRTDSCFGGT
jgi:hypothetical protein